MDGGSSKTGVRKGNEDIQRRKGKKDQEEKKEKGGRNGRISGRKGLTCFNDHLDSFSVLRNQSQSGHFSSGRRRGAQR